jgi:hypothetical protein
MREGGGTHFSFLFSPHKPATTAIELTNSAISPPRSHAEAVDFEIDSSSKIEKISLMDDLYLITGAISILTGIFLFFWFVLFGWRKF